MDVGQRDLDPLVGRYVYTGDTCHDVSLLRRSILR
jgi:hypothetical protein